MKRKIKAGAAGALLAAASLVPLSASADSGFYLGGAIGSATVEANVDVGLPTVEEFDKSDAGYKVFAGYNFQLSALALGLEGGYTNFGKPNTTIQGAEIAVEPTGINLWGIAALGLGPIDVYGKAGYLVWDADAIIDGTVSKDDGSDLGYGVGVRFNAGRLQIRGEYELFDIDQADLTMLSVGFAYRF